MITVELHAPTEEQLATKMTAYLIDHPGCSFKVYFCDYRNVWRASAIRK